MDKCPLDEQECHFLAAKLPACQDRSGCALRGAYNNRVMWARVKRFAEEGNPESMKIVARVAAST